MTTTTDELPTSSLNHGSAPASCADVLFCHRLGNKRFVVYGLLLACLGGVIAAAVLTNEKLVGNDYGIMMDGGSHHTGLGVYTWPARYNQKTPLVRSMAKQISSKSEVKPGISSYADNPQAIAASLKPLIDYAKTLVPKKQWASTPIFLRATAGMRLLNLSNPDGSAAVLAAVRKVFRDSGFYTQDRHVSIMPGWQEGLYGWVTVNYLLGELRSGSPETIGAMDLGGASTELTFEPHSEVKKDEHDITLFGRTYRPYAHSYLYYGAAEYGTLILNDLAAAAPQNKTIMNPCLPIGFSQNGTTNTSRTVLQLGSGDFLSCLSYARAVLHEPDFASVYRPQIPGDMKVIAFSNFASTVASLGLPQDASLNHIALAGQTFCASTYNPKTSLPWYTCVDAAVTVALCLDYGFKEDGDPRLEFREAYQGTDLDWTMGAMLFEADLLPPDMPRYVLPRDLGTAIILTLAAAAVLIASVAIWLSRGPSSARSLYHEF
eukprot:PLAT15899.1.p2 GENE.PLAT15899.1~~PLAT15899.1.p2  ORF type:complete len:490 (-),score=217.63 PLAT15899.1:37-1506(-)